MISETMFNTECVFSTWL